MLAVKSRRHTLNYYEVKEGKMLLLQRTIPLTLTKKILLTSLLLLSILTLCQLGAAAAIAQGGITYYVSPTGDDGNSGLSETEAWFTFERAWEDLYPGDTLILLDGVYRQSLHPNKRNGQPGNPITIRAKNDGQAIIDGEYQRVPVKIGDAWPGPINSYFVIEGIVARNSSGPVYHLFGADNNVLRRVSGYNAYSDSNTSVFSLGSAENNLLEDCVAAGTGRKMILIYKGSNNIVRRCFANWHRWDGKEWKDNWPWGENINIYFGTYNIVENSIGYGSTPLTSIVVYGPGSGSDSNKVIGNKVLGSMAVWSGMNKNGTPRFWGPDPNNPPLTQVQPFVRPQPSVAPADRVRNFGWPRHRTGFMLAGKDEVRDNLFQDIFSWGNAGLGITQNFEGPHSNNRIVRATIMNNGLDNPDGPSGSYGGIKTDATQADLSKFDDIQDSRIDNILVDWPDYYDGGQRIMTSMDGGGARLTHRYINGVLTDQPLWPWPMEDRIKAELGLSVTEIMSNLLSLDGFDLNVNPSFQNIEPGDTVTVTVSIIPTVNFTDTVILASASPSSNLILSPTGVAVDPPAQITLTLTDTHDNSFSSPLWYSVPLTATGGGLTQTTTVNLLMNGLEQFLPVIVK